MTRLQKLWMGGGGLLSQGAEYSEGQELNSQRGLDS